MSTAKSPEATREPALQDHYKALNPQLQAALLHARREINAERSRLVTATD